MIDYKSNWSEEEYIEAVAIECIDRLSEEDKIQLCKTPCSGLYHFGYGLYIRNNYIHNKNLPFFCDPDSLSGEIITKILCKLLPEEAEAMEDSCIGYEYNDLRFIQLRHAYKRKNGVYPVELIKRYIKESRLILGPLEERRKEIRKEAQDKFEKEKLERERQTAASKVKRLKVSRKLRAYIKRRDEMFKVLDEYNAYKKYVEERTRPIDDEIRKVDRDIRKKMISDLVHIVWQKNDILDYGEDKGIDSQELSEYITDIEDIFFEQYEYVPMSAVLLNYRNKLDENTYCLLQNEFNDAVEFSLHLPRIIEGTWLMNYLVKKKDDTE